MRSLSKPLFLGALVLLGIAVLWIWVIGPYLVRIPNDFFYHADVISLDNFYDEAKQQYSGEKRSVTKFSYDVAGDSSTKLPRQSSGQVGAGKDGILTVKNVFDVRTVTGDKIFAVERLYGVDPKTGKHVAGFGDRDRDGYLFAPRMKGILRQAKDKANFAYWHINYDGPAQMKFTSEEDINGLHVYRYETHYEGVKIDQTKNLGHLPGVGVTRGVLLEPYLQLWIEPVSGHLVKYKDDTVAYYYNLKTGERQNPWNHFSNTYTLESVLNQVTLAKQEKFTLILVDVVIPAVLAFLAIIGILFSHRKNKIGKLLLVGMLVAVVLTILAMWFSPKLAKPQRYTGPVEKINFSSSPGVKNGGVYIAKSKGYFQEEGLDVNLTEFPSGKQGFLIMLAGQGVDISALADTPIAIAALEKKDFYILATISEGHDEKVIARKDKGINVVADLKGKKVGLASLGIGNHYFLSTLLTFNGLAVKDVEIIVMDGGKLLSALDDGALDAIAVVEPDASKAIQLLGDKAVVFPNNGIYKKTFNMTVRRDFAQNHPETLIRFLRAIDKADKFIQENKEESQTMVAERLKLDKKGVVAIWDENSRILSLEQSLLLTLEGEARWAVENQITAQTKVPNYLDFIYFDPLESVKPDAVTIIR